ncbi:16S rRNA (guanine(966)-N(2))-methyltransferase RsmD [Legionella dresdenensis]|uniref:Ribosomal RNA small subunit methyltransferase D n=1 Tax=Legionella dresdenensis TaxID=450200 RepID=A0ABV8CF72_9GAMM
MKQTVRIIGGRYRGKKLSFPAIEGLRPTPDRIKETLFNWLMHDIHNLRCLDAFAGSGALGFEAFSRGAQHVTLIEASVPVFQNLKKQAQQFDSPALQVINSDALAFLRKTTVSFDLIFLDPPFADNLWGECLQLLENSACLAKGGLVYLESPQLIELNLEHWEALKSKQAGQVYYTLYRKR